MIDNLLLFSFFFTIFYNLFFPPSYVKKIFLRNYDFCFSSYHLFFFSSCHSSSLIQIYFLFLKIEIGIKLTAEELISVSLSFPSDTEMVAGTGTKSGISSGSGRRTTIIEEGSEAIDWISFLDFFNTLLTVRFLLFLLFSFFFLFFF